LTGSAPHGERFDLLKGSPLLRRVQEGGIKVYYTIVFLEETLRMITSGRQNAKTELIKQWPFLRSICSGGWFKPLLPGDPPRLNSVCDEELNESPKHSGWPLVNPSIRDAAEAMVDRLLRGSEPIPNMEAWQRSWDEANNLKNEQWALLVDLRNRHLLSKDATLTQYYQTMAEESAGLLIHRRLNVAQPDVALDAWRRDSCKFPHFTAYLELSIYSFFDAERNQNSRLDWNWQADSEQLCFLVDVDVMVSSDRGFMKTCV
jgi:hypothetical protein